MEMIFKAIVLLVSSSLSIFGNQIEIKIAIMSTKTDWKLLNTETMEAAPAATAKELMDTPNRVKVSDDKNIPISFLGRDFHKLKVSFRYFGTAKTHRTIPRPPRRIQTKASKTGMNLRIYFSMT